MALHAGVTYLARSFSIKGDRNELFGFLVSPRPVSRCAICRNISVVRWVGGDFRDHLAVVGGRTEHLRLERNGGDRLALDRLGELGGGDLRTLRHADLIEAI